MKQHLSKCLAQCLALDRQNPGRCSCISHSYRKECPDDIPSAGACKKSGDVPRHDSEAGVTGEEDGFAYLALFGKTALLEQWHPFPVTEDIQTVKSQTVVTSRLPFPHTKCRAVHLRTRSPPDKLPSPATAPISKLPGPQLGSAVNPVQPADKGPVW